MLKAEIQAKLEILEARVQWLEDAHPHPPKYEQDYEVLETDDGREVFLFEDGTYRVVEKE